MAAASIVATPIGLALEDNIGLPWLFRLRGAVEPPPNVAVVALDERSAIALGVPEKPREWPRSLHGRLIDALVASGADVIAFDLTFERAQPPAEDAAFARAMAAAQRVLLVEAIERRCTQGTDARAPPLCFEEVRQPVPALAEAALGIAPFPLPRTANSAVNAFWAFLGSSGDRPTLPALAVQAQALRHDEAWRRFFYAASEGVIGRTAGIEEPTRRLRQKAKTAATGDPLLPDGEIGAIATPALPLQTALREAIRRLYAGPDSRFLNFYGPPGTIRHISYSRLLAPPPGAGLPDLDGVAIFVGSSELEKPVQPDHFRTVFARDDGVEMSGAEVAATAYANLLTATTLRPVGPLTSAGLVLALAVVLTTCAYALPLRLAIIATGAVALAYTAAAAVLFARAQIWLPLAVPLLVVLPMAAAIGAGGHLLRAWRERHSAERARQQAEAANAARSAFLATMSHEIRTLLNWVTGLVEKLDRPGLDASERGLMLRVRQFSDNLLQLLNDVLDLARIDAGELRVVAEPVALRPLIQTVVDMLAPAAGQKGLSLVADVTEGVPPVVITDPLRLCQILWNLIGNAIKFTAQGTIRVRLDAGPRTDTGVMLVLQVEDSGIGVPEQAQAGLFEPFRQADARTAQQFGGSGLGLSIVRQLAGLMGGSIAVESRPGEGSTFTVRLQVAVAPTSAAPAPTAAAPVSYTGLPKLSMLRLVEGEGAAAAAGAGAAATGDVLVAEDDPLNRILIEGQLETLGLSAHLCADGDAAWECLQRHPVRLLLTDLQMPTSGDGPRLARRVRDDPRFRDLPIIGLTADARPAAIEACLAAGMNHVLLKPLRLPDLPEALRRLGILHPAEDDPAPPAPISPPPPEAAVPAFDPGNIVHAFGTIDAAARQLLDDFAVQATAMIEAVKAAARRREAVAVQQNAHRMAGSSASIGAIRLSSLFAGIDAAAAAADWRRIDPLVAKLDRCLTETQGAIADCGSVPAAADRPQLSAS